jgi:hypothetical protein
LIENGRAGGELPPDRLRDAFFRPARSPMRNEEVLAACA